MKVEEKMWLDYEEMMFVDSNPEIVMDELGVNEFTIVEVENDECRLFIGGIDDDEFDELTEYLEERMICHSVSKIGR